jgi:uncharacterized membrane protein
MIVSTTRIEEASVDTTRHGPARFRNPVLRRHTGDERELGQRAADTIAARAGSWAFIFLFLALLAVWMLYNGGRDSGRFDPYPFILLNLVLSCLAAIQAPVILMSQNRADQKRNELAEQDYRVNRRSEAENRVIAQVLGISAEDFVARVERELEGDLMSDRSPKG